MNGNLKTWYFGIKNDELIELVISGKKTATTCIYDGSVDDIGTESILVYDNDKKACITKTVNNIICKFKDVKWDVAKLEGENNSLDDWKAEHYNYFKSIDSNFTINTNVLIEVFEVNKKL